MYLRDPFNDIGSSFLWYYRSKANGKLYVSNVKPGAFKQSLRYMRPLIWNDLPLFLKSASSLDGYKKLYKRLLRN